MTQQEREKEAVGHIFEEMTRADLTVVDGMFDERYPQHTVLNVNQGRAQRFFVAFAMTLPDCRFDIPDIIADRDKAFLRANVSGIWKGD